MATHFPLRRPLVATGTGTVPGLSSGTVAVDLSAYGQPRVKRVWVLDGDGASVGLTARAVGWAGTTLGFSGAPSHSADIADDYGEALDVDGPFEVTVDNANPTATAVTVTVTGYHLV